MSYVSAKFLEGATVLPKKNREHGMGASPHCWPFKGDPPATVLAVSVVTQGGLGGPGTTLLVLKAPNGDLGEVYTECCQAACENCARPSMPHGTCHKCGRKWGGCE